METRVKGIYRNGRVELAERPANMPDGTNVTVTFVAPSAVDLRACGISQSDADDLRARLTSFAQEWDSPEMDAYDNYDAAIAERQAR
jgi:hypothetical protein